MLRILLVSARKEAVHVFAESLSSVPRVEFEAVRSGAEALRVVRTTPPELAIIDFELPDSEPLHLVQELLAVNAMMNTALVSPLSDEEFHEATEGLGILARLPLLPKPGEVAEVLNRLRQILGLANSN